MEYSEYGLDQLMSFPKYKEICEMFLGLAKDDETKQKLESILYSGGYKDYSPSGGIGKNNPAVDIKRRIGLAYLIVRNPETFNQIVDNKIIYFHGTSANALPSIMKNGLNSVDMQRERGDEVNTGEEWSRIGGGRDFISFTDVLDIAEGYSTISPETETELSFPIVFGTTKEDIISSDFTRIKSDVPEVGVKKSFPRESITCIMVPSSKTEIIKKIVGPEMLVLAIDDIEDRFYYINDDMFSIYIDEEKYNGMEKGIHSSEEQLTGVKETVFSRRLSQIKSKKDQLISFIKGDQSYERNATK